MSGLEANKAVANRWLVDTGSGDGYNQTGKAVDELIISSAALSSLLPADDWLRPNDSECS